eukprot:9188118-Karenia_brevis.AAC.1
MAGVGGFISTDAIVPQATGVDRNRHNSTQLMQSPHRQPVSTRIDTTQRMQSPQLNGCNCPNRWKRPKSMDANRVWNRYLDPHHGDGGAIWWFNTASRDWFYESTGSKLPPPTKGNLGGDASSDDMTVTTDTPDDGAESTPYSETTTTQQIQHQPNQLLCPLHEVLSAHTGLFIITCTVKETHHQIQGG